MEQINTYLHGPSLLLHSQDGNRPRVSPREAMAIRAVPHDHTLSQQFHSFKYHPGPYEGLYSRRSISNKTWKLGLEKGMALTSPTLDIQEGPCALDA